LNYETARFTIFEKMWRFRHLKRLYN